MSYAVDLHTHSPYAHGTSKRLTFENLAKWARIKGIDLLVSGDFTQPVWAAETRAKLRDLGNGLFEYGGRPVHPGHGGQLQRDARGAATAGAHPRLRAQL